ncbi:small multi-drug export protein [Paraferrimonas sp. SM1919]|uniref:small multi-drug export protein n=1 Tax=Paraferrimonas sp. SM1919 TaxID=2662263 RepID=UPI0013D42429|nr:small multi-drug export protein [Paraferrimonas sp. SM1919]
MNSYLLKASSAWLLSFFPLGEVFVSVPAAIATGLDYYSIIFWCVFGNFSAALLLIAAYKKLVTFNWFQLKIDKLKDHKAKHYFQRYGSSFVLAATPIIGVWTMAITAKLFGFKSRKFLALSFTSILIYSVAIIASFELGLSALA